MIIIDLHHLADFRSWNCWHNDVPITTISKLIEIDIREMIGEDKKNIPDPYKNNDDTEM